MTKQTFFCPGFDVGSTFKEKEGDGWVVRVARSVESRVPVAVGESQEILVEIQKPGEFIKMSMLSGPQESETLKRISKRADCY